MFYFYESSRCHPSFLIFIFCFSIPSISRVLRTRVKRVVVVKVLRFNNVFFPTQFILNIINADSKHVCAFFFSMFWPARFFSALYSLRLAHPRTYYITATVSWGNAYFFFLSSSRSFVLLCPPSPSPTIGRRRVVWIFPLPFARS